jgi:hypothetical protein
MSGRVLLLVLRSRQDWRRDWPRYREGAKQDERRSIESLSDRELAQLAAGLGQVDKAVRDFRSPEKAADKFLGPKKDAA